MEASLDSVISNHDLWGWDHNGGSNFYMEYIIEKNLNKYSILFNNIMPRKAVYSAKAT